MPKEEMIEDLGLFSGDEARGTSRGFMIKLGEDVLKKKEEIENIYKEEDKKKERLKREFSTLVDEMKVKIAELKGAIGDEQKQLKLLNLDQFQNKRGGDENLQENAQAQISRKRSSMSEDGKIERMGKEQVQILLKR